MFHRFRFAAWRPPRGTRSVAVAVAAGYPGWEGAIKRRCRSRPSGASRSTRAGIPSGPAMINPLGALVGFRHQSGLPSRRLTGSCFLAFWLPILPVLAVPLGGAFPAALPFLFYGEGCPPGCRGRLSDVSSGPGLWADGDGIDGWFMGFVLGDVSHGENALKRCFAVSWRIRGCG